MQRLRTGCLCFLLLSGGCFGEAPNIGDGGASTGGEGTDGDTAEPTSGTTRIDESGPDSTQGEVGDATATGGDATSSEATSSEATSSQDETSISESSDSDTSTTAVDDTAAAGCEHLVFVTAEFWNADLGGLSGADDKCAEAAEALGGTWMAVLSTAAQSAASRIQVQGQVCDLQGAVIADDEIQWWSASHHAAINVTQHAEELPATSWRVWTATNPAGEATTNDCTQWTSDGGVATVGDAQRSDGWWVFAEPQNLQQCGFNGRLYCFRLSD